MYQYFRCRQDFATVPLLPRRLCEWGCTCSPGQVTSHELYNTGEVLNMSVLWGPSGWRGFLDEKLQNMIPSIQNFPPRSHRTGHKPLSGGVIYFFFFSFSYLTTVFLKHHGMAGGGKLKRKNGSFLFFGTIV